MTVSEPTVPVSIAELFTIGIGPSSSHTVGPMRAARRFAALAAADQLPVRVRCTLHGSLALTGRGHATDTAVLLGLAGWEPETIDPDAVPAIVAGIRESGRLPLDGATEIAFDEARDLVLDPSFLADHPNGMVFEAVFADGDRLTRRYASIGGGAIVEAGAPARQTNVSLRHDFASAAELLALGKDRSLTIAEIVRANEEAWRPAAETDALLDRVHQAMSACIDRGLTQDGVLPGGLGVRRRARALHDRLNARGGPIEPADVFEWVSLWALAVNEENAAGGRVVTAPTNGAAGVIPAVLRYYTTFVPGADAAGVRRFLYTAAAIGLLYKKRASISAAEMGCQGEVGVACSMAAAGLAAVLGASNMQVENAAEIGMEHNLGLTCDPVGGLVQIPCIERNTMGAVKAINAAYLALRGDGAHIVSLDAVIETMRQTGVDMQSRYKETSQGGLAVNVVEC
ncbi:L-serine ammonia-lyase [Hephaestia mangrovi]|uniref:L-serine ammonia-lyase n=1 Tax=Hephaestia mangrovi TaxID=2873268 RepID=UPI001CA5F6AB|nr:L-serine ammonia-lyase [Hephaestia mangrovi]MBY8828020.1 L-serine ammonia-lyase [Hephaestia mangrovi]